MSLTKTQARDLIRQVIDDPAAAMWSDVNLDLLIELSLDEMWGEIFNYSPWFKTQLDTITSLTSPGYLDLRTVANGGALSQRFHRLQNVVRGGRSLTKYDPRDSIVELNKEVYAPQDSYTFFGDQLWIFPLDTSADVEIRYAFKPAGFTTLSAGNPVIWPDGHESAYVYEIAARAIVKGDRESNQTILSIAGKSWDRLIDMVRKRQIGPTVPWANDSQHEFGGI